MAHVKFLRYINNLIHTFICLFRTLVKKGEWRMKKDYVTLRQKREAMKYLKLIFAAVLLLCSAPTQEVCGQIISQTRCEAITRNGTRCRNKALEQSKYCRVHQANDPKVAQCMEKTQKGSRCRRPSKIAGYCTQHYKMKLQGKVK